MKLRDIQETPVDLPLGTRNDPLLQVDGLVKHFPTRKKFLRAPAAAVKAVDGVSLSIHRGQTLGLVGESGCGKSTTGRAIVRLLEPDAGSILFDGVDISRLSPTSMRPIRRRLQFVFQDPFASLNPRLTVNRIIGEPLEIHGIAGGEERQARVDSVLERVGLKPEHRSRFAHEFSGGQRQRIGIARALVLEPELLVLDEPVSALDVSIQAQIINLLKGLQDELGLAYLLIAHDLGVIRHLCDDVAVMYLGRIVEQGTRSEIFENVQHPYTSALLSAVPRPDPLDRRTDRIVLHGELPNPASPPSGCRFHTRCWKRQERCTHEDPSLTVRDGGTQPVACHYPVTPEMSESGLAEHRPEPVDSVRNNRSIGRKTPDNGHGD